MDGGNNHVRPRRRPQTQVRQGREEKPPCHAQRNTEIVLRPVNISSLANGALSEHRRAIPALAQRGRVGRAEGRPTGSDAGKVSSRPISSAFSRRVRSTVASSSWLFSGSLVARYWWPSREPEGSDEAGTCARRQPLERALSDLPQIPAPGRGVSATSQPVREVGSSIPTVQLLFQTHARGDEILPWQNDRNNREPTCGNEPREIGNRSWRTLAPFSFFISSKAQPCPCAAYHIHLVVRWHRPPRSRTLSGSVPWGKASGGVSRQKWSERTNIIP